MRISDWSSDVCSSDLATRQSKKVDIFEYVRKQKLALALFGVNMLVPPPKAEVTGSNPVGCATFFIYASFSMWLASSLANRFLCLAINISAAASESDRKSTRLNSSH